MLVLYDGAVGRVLAGAEITERALVAERAQHRQAGEAERRHGRRGAGR